MANYTNMVKSNHDRSEAMLNLSLTTISEMVEDGEKVTVAELVRRTGFSRDYFYDKGNSRYTCVLDQMLGIAKYERVSAAVSAALVTEARKKKRKQVHLPKSREIIREKPRYSRFFRVYGK